MKNYLQLDFDIYSRIVDVNKLRQNKKKSCFMFFRTFLYVMYAYSVMLCSICSLGTLLKKK